MIDGISELSEENITKSISGEELPKYWPQLMSEQDEEKAYDVLFDEGEDRNILPTHPQIDGLSYELENGDKRLRYFAVRHQRNMVGTQDPNMVQYEVLEEKFNQSPPQLVLYEGYIDDVNIPLTRKRAIQLGEPAFMAYLVQQHNSKLNEGDSPVIIESADLPVNSETNEIRDPYILKNIASKLKTYNKVDIVMGSGHAIRERAALEQFFK